MLRLRRWSSCQCLAAAAAVAAVAAVAVAVETDSSSDGSDDAVLLSRQQVLGVRNGHGMGSFLRLQGPGREVAGGWARTLGAWCRGSSLCSGTLLRFWS